MQGVPAASLSVDIVKLARIVPGYSVANNILSVNPSVEPSWMDRWIGDVAETIGLKKYRTY